MAEGINLIFIFIFFIITREQPQKKKLLNSGLWSLNFRKPLRHPINRFYP